MWYNDKEVKAMETRTRLGRPKEWDRQALIDYGCLFYGREGRLPKVRDWMGVKENETDPPSYLTCVREFGTWNAYLDELEKHVERPAA